ncbi:MAG: hypothetical protein GC136_08390 [Alphaproteobacteria bacterium]|nr:hypothetical protein [Alphaproteobacteria bacterium]
MSFEARKYLNPEASTIVEEGCVLDVVRELPQPLILIDKAVSENPSVRELLDNKGAAGIVFFQCDEHLKSIADYAQNCSIIPDLPYESVVVIGSGVLLNFAYYFLADKYQQQLQDGTLKVVVAPTNTMAIADVAIGSLGLMNDNFQKNAVRKYCDPDIVLLDKALFMASPLSQQADGCVEVLKHALMQDEGAIEQAARAFLRLEKNPETLYRLAHQGLQQKSLIQDVFLTTERKDTSILLSYGHLVAHAIEEQSGFAVPHSSAVFVGLLCDLLLMGHEEMAQKLMQLAQGSALQETINHAVTVALQCDLDALTPQKHKFRDGNNFRVVALSKLGQFSDLEAPIAFKIVTPQEYADAIQQVAEGLAPASLESNHAAAHRPQNKA